MGINKQSNATKSYHVNDDIKYDGMVRVIYKDNNDETKSFNKVMHISTAKRIANEYGLDLIEINSSNDMPITKIYDYTKFLWEKKIADKKNKQHAIIVKEIQLKTNISTHDMETKARKTIEMLGKGFKVKVILTMRGRELTRREESKRAFYEFLSMVGENVVFDMNPKDEGNKTMCVLRSKQHK